jgi:hypothetical protein
MPGKELELLLRKAAVFRLLDEGRIFHLFAAVQEDSPYHRRKGIPRVPE